MKVKFRTSRSDTEFGRELIAAAKEALAHTKGEIVLPTRFCELSTRKRKPRNGC